MIIQSNKLDEKVKDVDRMMRELDELEKGLLEKADEIENLKKREIEIVAILEPLKTRVQTRQDDLVRLQKQDLTLDTALGIEAAKIAKSKEEWDETEKRLRQDLETAQSNLKRDAEVQEREKKALESDKIELAKSKDKILEKERDLERTALQLEEYKTRIIKLGLKRGDNQPIEGLS